MRSETDVGKIVVAYLRDHQWRVYQEVNGLDADIVAVQTRGGGLELVWAIELKLHLSFRVLDQAMQRRPFAHWASVAVPHRKLLASTPQVFRMLGIGLLLVAPVGVQERIAPGLNRKALARFTLDRLHEQQQTFALAGSSGGAGWSSFKQTCAYLRRHVEQNPGCLVKDAVEQIKHHYASDGTAVSCLAHWLRRGVMAGIAYRIENRRARLYPEPEKAEKEKPDE